MRVKSCEIAESLALLTMRLKAGRASPVNPTREARHPLIDVGGDRSWPFADLPRFELVNEVGSDVVTNLLRDFFAELEAALEAVSSNVSASQHIDSSIAHSYRDHYVARCQTNRERGTYSLSDDSLRQSQGKENQDADSL
jgi:hypothetical protein